MFSVLGGFLLALPASAIGDGLPVPTGTTTNEISTSGGGDRYVASRHGENTQLTRISEGRPRATVSVLPGRYTVPVVATDGTASGLSADGNTLVLIKPRQRFPQERTELQIVDTSTFTHRAVTLRGDFSFDAISPDGGSLYFIHYTSPRDPTDYEVRAYNTAAGHLLKAPIVDADEPDEEMSGFPLVRVQSPDGRWAYTLYGGTGGKPFVHALDTATGTAHCIDLNGVPRWRLGLTANGDGSALMITRRGEPIREIDTSTLEVGPPGSASEGASGASTDDGFFAPLFAGLALAAGVALVGAFVLRRRRLASA
jgi:hypothetical protein